MRIIAEHYNIRSNLYRFGWSKSQPPQHQLEIDQADLTDEYKPTSRFMKKLSDFLVREGNLNKPGFATLSNFETLIPQEKQESFLRASILKLKHHLETVFPKALNPENVPLTIIKRHMVDGKVLKEGNISSQNNQGNWTLKIPHFDRGAFIVMHKYNPPKNVTGGNFQVIDVNQFLADNPEINLSDMLDDDKQLLPNYWEKLKPYTLTLNTNRALQTAVVINNTAQGGIAHSVTPVFLKDKTKPFKRDYERFTITRFEPNKKLPPDVFRVEEEPVTA
jgi:hypothetical protein